MAAVPWTPNWASESEPLIGPYWGRGENPRPHYGSTLQREEISSQQNGDCIVKPNVILHHDKKPRTLN